MGRTVDKMLDAVRLAHQIHKDDVRKFTRHPYVTHLAEVAGLMSAVTWPKFHDHIVITSWLHDAVEDHPDQITLDEIKYRFTFHSEEGVMLLTKDPRWAPFPKKEREMRYIKRLMSAPGWVQSIKCADILSNCRTVLDVCPDPKWSRPYFIRKLATVEALTNANEGLRALVLETLLEIAVNHGMTLDDAAYEEAFG